MPIIESLSFGLPWTMKANQVYAAPPVAAVVYTDAASPTITQSMTQAFTTSTPVTMTGGVGDIFGLFLKAAADTLVVIKRK